MTKNSKCEICDDTGIISSVADDDADYVHYGEIRCGCKEEEDE